ncbi:hypothetical protein [Deinococcus sedimenti]|uniref:Lipoprotein n=1 Tax=Deinococcus sedimenti TaxID=1867090 RepID=A0ABQ2S7B4_9DEIO|nr:hypothetical protein [Deinococcus sedimenti]GGR95436.1 hypothetical protein GCM10008960_22960 [Deinococcus sedimenti]
MRTRLRSALICSLLAAPALSGCGSLVRAAADGQQVAALPIAGQDVGGEVTPVPTPQALSPQAVASGTLTYAATFDDVSYEEVVSRVGNPSKLEIPMQFAGASFACAPTAAQITVTLKTFTMTAKDAGGQASVELIPAGSEPWILKMNRNAGGTYDLANPSQYYGLGVSYTWEALSPVIGVKAGGNTPNTLTISANAAVDGVPGVCLVKLRLSPTLKQRIRF